MTEKENVDYLTSSTLLRYRQTPLHHIRVKAHAIRREPFSFTLGAFSIWRFSKARIQANVSISIRHCLFYVISILYNC